MSRFQCGMSACFQWVAMCIAGNGECVFPASLQCLKAGTFWCHQCMRDIAQLAARNGVPGSWETGLTRCDLFQIADNYC
jgi:hypothetical protein